MQNVLLGQGVTVSNIQFNGVPVSIGYFNGQNTNIGFNEGIVITTGTVLNDGNGPHGPNTSGSSGVDNFGPSSALLASQLGGGAATFNAATLEFDFVPFSDTVRFSYVFASEEYPEYVGSQFNDVFGFFISGPGIPGGQRNIAAVPTTGQVVAINNINNGAANDGPCMNCEFYRDNTETVTSPQNIQYDGMTTILEAVSRVQCGETYHLVIAIADVGDGLWDSGIFLEANSLSSETPVDISYEMSRQAYQDKNLMAEACVTTTVTVERSGDISAPQSIPVTLSGTATEIVDYTDIPSTVDFAANQSVTTFSFDALEDGLVEGIETLEIQFNMFDPCGNFRPITLNLAIQDVDPFSVDLPDTSVLCSGDELELAPVITGGLDPYTMQWSTGESSSSITINPTVTSSYSVVVTDGCLNDTDSASNTVIVPIYPPIVLDITDDITEICPFLNDTLNVEASGGAGTYTYQWFDNRPVLLGLNKTQAIKPAQTTEYSVVVTDICGVSDTARMTYTITSPPLLVTPSPEQVVCPFDSTDIFVSAEGGFGDYYFDWQHSNDSTAGITVVPPFTNTYTVHVSDDCQTFFVPASVKVIVTQPEANFFVGSNENIIMERLPITFQNTSIGAVSYEWDFGDGNTSEQVHPNNTFTESGSYLVTLVATSEIGCKDTVDRFIQIKDEVYIYVPNVFTPDQDDFNGTFHISTIGIYDLETRIYDRWGQIIYEGFDPRFEWDGKDKAGRDVAQGVYTYQLNFKTVHGDERQIIGHVTLLR